ncbi:FUSC family protein [Inquilinus limosus]|uniref:FUSC family protein n=1 Tax=Inquilinus limosus TaxID=171674 RepID=UPI0015C5A7BE|nr:FUSC family protein [Inquilinus limosus]
MIQLSVPRLDPIHVRQAVRGAVAAVAAYALAEAFGLPKGYWSVLTAVIVLQATLGATLGATVDRLLGTLLGAAFGVTGAVLSGPSALRTGAVLLLVMLATVYIAARRPSLRLGSVTAAIVMLSDPSHADPLGAAFQRVAEIGLGTVVGVLAALLILPSRARDHLRDTAADALGQCAGLLALIAGRLAGAEAEADATAINQRIRTLLRKADGQLDEARRERPGAIPEHLDPAPIIRTVRRLWYSEIILNRAARSPLSPALQAALAATLDQAVTAAQKRMTSMAAALEAQAAPGDGGALDQAVAALQSSVDALRGASGEGLDGREFGQAFAIAFTFAQIRDNLADLAERLREQAGEATAPLTAD